MISHNIPLFYEDQNYYPQYASRSGVILKSQWLGLPLSQPKFILFMLMLYILVNREHSGSVVECLTRDRGAAGSSLTGVTAPWSLSKTHLS